MGGAIKVLDCTLRDGGLGLEDAWKNGIARVELKRQDVESVADLLANARIDIVELGSVEITSDDRRCFCIYPDIEHLSAMMPGKRTEGQKFAALYRGPDTPLEDIPPWSPSLCEIVRVIIRYSELQKSLDFCAALAEKGYKVFVQPMLTMRYSDDELDVLINRSNEMGASALYFVDSYGYMTANDVRRFFDLYDGALNPGIAIGFHAHNNMNMALANVLSFIGIETDRPRIVDCCLLGMGQGAGNLQTELLIGSMSREWDDAYDFPSVLDACDIVQGYLGEALWGYSPTRLLPALHKTAYKFAVYYRHRYGLSYREINQLLEGMPAQVRHRFTPEDAEKVLKAAKREGAAELANGGRADQ